MPNALTSHPPESDTVIQPFGAVVPVRLGLDTDVRMRSVAPLNRILAHTTSIRDVYKKAQRQAPGPLFYELHLLFDKHFSEQEELMDAIAERVQTLGGVSMALASDVADETRISRAPRGVESTSAQLNRIVASHELILEDVRPLAREAAARGDDGTNDLMVSQVLRTNELQSWFISRSIAAAKVEP